MKYLLDTNVCVAVLNNRPPGVRIRLERTIEGGHRPSISILTSFELWYGVYKSRLKEENTERLRLFLSPLNLIPFEEDDVPAAARLRAHLEREGTPIGPYDLLIAAQALCRDFILVTNNFREFKRVPELHTEDWLTDTLS